MSLAKDSFGEALSLLRQQILHGSQKYIALNLKLSQSQGAIEEAE